jgi:hypothetical protein
MGKSTINHHLFMGKSTISIAIYTIAFCGCSPMVLDVEIQGLVALVSTAAPVSASWTKSGADFMSPKFRCDVFSQRGKLWLPSGNLT